MKRFDQRSYVIRCEENFQGNEFLKALQRAKIPLQQIEVNKGVLRFTVQKKYFSQLKKIRRQYRVKIKISDIEKYNLIQKDAFMWMSFLLFLCVPIILNAYLWEIEIVQATPELEDSISSIIEGQLQISEGQTVKQLPTEAEMRQEILATHPELSWVFISKVGSKLVVEVKYAPVLTEAESEQRIGHLVARSSGVITHVDVERGERLVTQNMTVFEGDLLVSGIVSFDKQDFIVGAAGEVYADYWLNTEFSMPNTIEVTTVKDRAWYVRGVKIPKQLSNFREAISTIFTVEETVDLETKTFQLNEENAENYILPILQQKILQSLPKHSTIKEEKLLRLTFENDKVEGNILLLINENIAILQPIDRGE